MIGSTLEMKYGFYIQKDEETDEATKEANLMAGDMINNFKTIQSFGNQNQVVKNYEKALAPMFANAGTSSLIAGVAYGFSQFAQWTSIGLMFLFAGLLMENSEIDPETGMPAENPENMFMAVFCIMFGAMRSGSAQQFGPDMAKALKAAGRVFNIFDKHSKIDAQAIRADSSKKRLNLDDVKGEIEFKNVWFRYPTRKEEFVL